MSLPTYSTAEVAKHTTEKDCWMVIEGAVYDVTKWLSDHPGGKKVLLREAGKDATEKFRTFHREGVLEKYGKPYMVGLVESPAGKAASGAVVVGRSRTPSKL